MICIQAYLIHLNDTYHIIVLSNTILMIFLLNYQKIWKLYFNLFYPLQQIIFKNKLVYFHKSIRFRVSFSYTRIIFLNF